MTTLIIISWLLAAAAAWAIGAHKGHGRNGLLTGLFLGWIGLIAVLFWKPTREVKIQREVQRQEIADAAAREVWRRNN